MKKILVCLAIGISILCLASISQATLITSSATIDSQVIVDFSEFSGGWIYTSGPVQIGNPVNLDVTWESTFSSSVIGNGNYGLGDNGSWDSPRNGYVGLNTRSGDMTILFNDGLVSAVGGFLNYAPGHGTMSISALDASLAILESYSPSISTPGGLNEGAFYGISRGDADIYGFRISNAYVVMDDLTFGGSGGDPIPEPCTMLLLGTGLVGLAGIGRRRFRRNS